MTNKFLALLLGLFLIGYCIQSKASIHEWARVSELKAKGETFLVVYSAKWCGYCVKYKDTIAQVTDREVIIIDIDRFKEELSDQNLYGVPATDIFVDGKLKERLYGYITIEKLKRAMEL